jgi:hypothetical protein
MAEGAPLVSLGTANLERSASATTLPICSFFASGSAVVHGRLHPLVCTVGSPTARAQVSVEGRVGGHR